MWLRQVANVASRNNQGKCNVFGSITLATSSASTNLVDPRLTIASVVILVPTNAHSTTESLSGNFYADYSTLTNGQITIKHTNNSVSDRTFRYVIFG